ncbi:hypothetical protein DPMN_028079 [Dreissena polymorpha]|uniref:Uncharacterized protein n=1 Tax=Dreissena polymorpha TaxID=45954 RepID=A0A9D4LW01_DREPO|nr:hypothetical protein DPMN_028079 [Dreissena polymorpha]
MFDEQRPLDLMFDEQRPLDLIFDVQRPLDLMFFSFSVPLTIPPILNNTKTTNSYARGPISKSRTVSFSTVYWEFTN